MCSSLQLHHKQWARRKPQVYGNTLRWTMYQIFQCGENQQSTSIPVSLLRELFPFWHKKWNSNDPIMLLQGMTAAIQEVLYLMLASICSVLKFLLKPIFCQSNLCSLDFEMYAGCELCGFLRCCLFRSWFYWDVQVKPFPSFIKSAWTSKTRPFIAQMQTDVPKCFL